MDKKIELHIQFMKLFKKVLEAGIKLEKEIENPQKYGYIVSHADPHYDIFFDSDSTFMNMMNSKKIILQSKLPHDKIYYFLFILATIINQDFVSFGVDDFIFEYYHSNFLDLNPDHDVDDEGIDYEDPVQYMNLLLQETGEFWIDHCGHRKLYRPPHCIYDFGDSTFERFPYMDGKYCKKITTNKVVQHPDGTKETQKIDNFIDYMSSSSMKKTNQERILYNMRKASPFSFGSPDIIEYTLPMMLHYVQQQIDLYEVLPTFTLLNEDIKIKGKTPFMIQKYINMGLSIEEVLEAVGY